MFYNISSNATYTKDKVLHSYINNDIFRDKTGTIS